MAEVTLARALDQVVNTWRGRAVRGEMSGQSLEKFELLAARFGRFCTAQGIGTLNDVEPEIVSAFVHAMGRDRQDQLVNPGVSTQHLRRASLRLLFSTARRDGLTIADPARDITLPPRSVSARRPVTDDEAALLRDYAVVSERPTRHAACIALALAGVHTGELGHITIGDLDLDNQQVRAHGASKATPRHLPLGLWASEALAQRARDVDPHHQPNTLLVSTAAGTDGQRHAAACVAIREIIIRAGLGTEPDLSPSSLTAYAGATTFQTTGHIEDAARTLGLHSLDRTAAMIGYDWTRSGGC